MEPLKNKIIFFQELGGVRNVKPVESVLISVRNLILFNLNVSLDNIKLNPLLHVPREMYINYNAHAAFNMSDTQYACCKTDLMNALQIYIKCFQRSMSKHNTLHHNKNAEGTLFLTIDTFTPNWRGNHIGCEISRLKTKWIYLLKSYVPYGHRMECKGVY